MVGYVGVGKWPWLSLPSHACQRERCSCMCATACVCLCVCVPGPLTHVTEILECCTPLWPELAARVNAVQCVCVPMLVPQASYLDLYLIHWPVTGSVGPEVHPSLADTWRAMEELVAKGLVRLCGAAWLPGWLAG